MGATTMRRAERAALWPLLRSIRVRMVVAFGLLFAMVLAAVGWMGLQGVPFTSLGGRAGRETAEAFRSLNLIADLKKEDLMRWLKERRDDTHILAESPFVADEVAQLRQAIRELAAAGNSDTEIRRRASGEKSYSDLVDLLNDVRDVYGVYGAIQVTDAETGRLLVSTEGGDRRHEAPGISDFAAPADSDNSIVGDAEIGPGGQPLFRVYHGIRDRAGEIIAVLMMEVGFDRVVRSMLIAREGLGATGEVLLVNRDARILTSLKYELADGSAARLLEYQIRAKPAKLAAAGEEGIIEAVDYRGERVLAAYRHIRMAPEFGWGLVVKRDESDLLAALREDMLSTAAIAAAAILVVIVLTGLFARRLTAPILALSRAADRVAGGDLTARAPVSTPDEVGVLARTFNSMVGRIQGWHAELEAQVADRTADLRAQIAERERAEEATRGAQQKLIEQQRSETQRIRAELDKARAQLVSQTRLAAIGQLAGALRTSSGTRWGRRAMRSST
jgi:HAMP domain-containing protein